MGPNKMEATLLPNDGHNKSLMILEKGLPNKVFTERTSQIYEMIMDGKNGKLNQNFGKANGLQLNGTHTKKQKLVMLMIKEYQLFLTYKYKNLQYGIIPIMTGPEGKQIYSNLMKKCIMMHSLKIQEPKLPAIENVNHKAERKSRQQEVRADYHIHRRAESLFSTSSGFTNFRGFLNLALLMLIFSATRVALENIIKYGVLIDPAVLLNHALCIKLDPTIISIVFYNNVNIIIACCLERLIAVNAISELCTNLLHIVNLCMQISFPVFVILIYHPNPVYSSLTLMGSVIIFLKLVSYKQTRMWCRLHMKRLAQIQPIAKQNGHSQSAFPKQPVLYPSKLSFSHLYYFMCLPTLCYEISFPKSKCIRKRFLMKRLLETAIIMCIIIAIIQQWILPIIHNALVPFSEVQLPQMLERILKLVLPNFCIWVMWFYVTFHSIFNILAEIMKFGDRNFYQDWWNSESVSEFWQKWNIPVHRWATRHVYKPMLLAGYTKFQSSLVVFAMSALFHELLVSVPLGLFRLYAFMGLIIQVPLAVLTAKLHSISPKMCNVIVWLSLIIIQPVAVLMYYVDYYVENQIDT